MKPLPTFSLAASIFLLSESLLQAQTSSPTPSSSPAPGGGCSSTVPETEGPYYLDLNLVRSDITEGKPGVPLQLRMEVVSASTCQPIPGVTVDVWHADATGNYSGFEQEGSEGPGPGGSAPANSQTFLRGSQLTDAQGIVNFRSIYPGWYPGRAVHIHYKVHGSADNEFTSQLFFDDSLSDQVYQQSPYNTRTGTRTLNANDMVLNSRPDPQRTLFPQTTYENGTVTATIRIVVTP